MEDSDAVTTASFGKIDCVFQLVDLFGEFDSLILYNTVEALQQGLTKNPFHFAIALTFNEEGESEELPGYYYLDESKQIQFGINPPWNKEESDEEELSPHERTERSLLSLKIPEIK